MNSALVYSHFRKVLKMKSIYIAVALLCVTIAMSSQGAIGQDHSHGHGSAGHHGHLTMTSEALVAALQSGGLALIVRQFYPIKKRR